MVVGDEAQSIYSFRAATVRNILDFPKQFRPAADIITLEQNYRSTQPILDACNRVIRSAKERYTKNLRSDRRSKQKPFLTVVADEAAQARFVAQQILDSREAGVPLKSQAVLFRASHHSAQLEIELTRRNIPFVKYGGLKFLEAAHIKDVLSILRWCENPRDRVAGFRAVQLLPGIGPGTAAKILDQVEGEPHATNVLYAIKVPKAAAEDWPTFAKLVEQLGQIKILQCSSLLPCRMACYPLVGLGQWSTRFRTFQFWPKDFSASVRQVECAVDRRRRPGGNITGFANLRLCPVPSGVSARLE